MTTGWQPKPGDRIFRPRRIRLFRPRRVLGVPALFSAGYGDVGSSIYYGLGVIALVALGATPIVLAIAGILYIFNSLTYAEGNAMIGEAGGSASFARHGFNNTTGFIAGWALMLSYIATMAIAAYTIPPYLAYFWPFLKQPVIGTAVSMGIILFLMVINILGIRESTSLNIFFIVIDILTQLTLVILGVLLIVVVSPHVLLQNMFGPGNWPSVDNFVFGIAIAALCFTGVETVSQLAEETRRPEKRIPHAYVLMIMVVLILFAGISIVALSAMTPQELGNPETGWARDPIAGIAHSISSVLTPTEIANRIASGEALVVVLTRIITIARDMLPGLVAILAAIILLTATNAGLMGISRLTFNLSAHHQLPATLSRIHQRFHTPYIAITLFCLIALLMLSPGFFQTRFFADLATLYVFGSLLCFALAHAAILALRVRKPDSPRPFRLGWNIRLKGRELPVTAILGLIGTSVIWLIVVNTQPYSLRAGAAWMIGGLIFYSLYRWQQRRPLLRAGKKADGSGSPVKSRDLPTRDR